MDLVNNYIYILEIPINIISKLRSLLRKNIEKKERAKTLSLFFLVLLLKSHNT
jgi:hypothetical protein